MCVHQEVEEVFMYTPQPQRSCAPRMMLIMLAAFVLLASPVIGQQTYVTQFDAYSGFAYLDSPHVNLAETGWAAQFGFRPKTWYSIGFDYSLSTGDLTLTPNLLPTALQQQLGAELGGLVAAGVIPPSYTLAVKAHSRTQTFAFGPQLAYRHFKQVTLFLRPVFAGAIHETATPAPTPLDPVATGVVAQLVPAGHKTDTAPFIGFGGGFDILFGKHFALRTQADLVYDHLFNDLLQDGRFTTRFSIGPAFNFGKNIAEPAK
jgi:hypothetical protein